MGFGWHPIYDGKKDWNHQPDNLYLVHVQPHPQRFESVQGGAPPVMFVGL